MLDILEDDLDPSVKRVKSGFLLLAKMIYRLLGYNFRADSSVSKGREVNHVGKAM
jgi:hypothetical protein